MFGIFFVKIFSLQDSDAVQLTLGLTLNQIHDINEEDNKMIADIWMSYSWMDVSLTWDEQNYPIVSFYYQRCSCK